MKITGVLLSLSCLASTAFANENGTVKIYDAQLKPVIISLSSSKPGRLVLSDGKKESYFVPSDAYVLNKNLSRVRDYFFEKFARRSWDGKGGDIIATMNINKHFGKLDLLNQKQNAFWSGTQFVFGAGADDGIDSMVDAIDVTAHEYTHAVIQSTSNLDPYGQAGALHEHLADVFGSIINVHYNHPQNPYLIGATILRGTNAKQAKALRDMMNPGKGLMPQPKHMDDLKLPLYADYGAKCVPSMKNDKCGVHIISGIPNRMAALVMSAIGPENAAPLFYNVMTKRLKENSNFTDYRNALLEECKSLSSDTCGIVEDALNSVGIPAFVFKPLTFRN